MKIIVHKLDLNIKSTYLCRNKNEKAMKKVKTFKELQNHPFVNEVWIEDSEGVIDGCEQTYWLELVEGKIFKNLDSICICEGSKKQLVDSFNYEINS